MSMQKDKKKKLKSLKEADERMKKQKSGEKASRGKKGGKKIAVGIAAGAVVILAAGYGVVGMQFRDRFYPGTVINGIDSGQKTVEEVKTVIRQQSEDYSITIHEMGDQQEVIAGKYYPDEIPGRRQRGKGEGAAESPFVGISDVRGPGIYSRSREFL